MGVVVTKTTELVTDVSSREVIHAAKSLKELPEKLGFFLIVGFRKCILARQKNP